MAELSAHAKLLLDVATQEAKRRGHNPVAPVHLVAGLIRRNRDEATQELGEQAIQDVATAMKHRQAEVTDTLAIEAATTELLSAIRSAADQWDAIRDRLAAAVEVPEAPTETPSVDAATPDDGAPPELGAVVASFLAQFDLPASAPSCDAAASDRWLADEPHLRALLDDAWQVAVSVAAADGTFGERELQLLSEAFGAHAAPGFDLAATVAADAVPVFAARTAPDHQHSGTDATGQPPPVLVALVRADAEAGTNHARAYALALVEIGRLVASCDEEVSAAEARQLDRLRLTFRAALATGAASAPPAAVRLGSSLEPTGVDAVLARLDGLVGLDAVKTEICARLELFRINDLRRRRGLPTEAHSLHMAFLGNPGTGKTTVARLVGELFAAAGALRKGHLVEADRSKFVAQYLGQTSHLVNETVERAKGGVLFIDEAYSLSSASLAASGAGAYEREAVDTLVKLLEDHRDDLIVIVAGYTAPMEHFLRSNEGLASRVPTRVRFDDYDDHQLMAIVDSMLRESARVATDEALAKLAQGLVAARREDNFGNARAARNVLESALRNQAVRLAHLGDLATDDELATIEVVDVPDTVSSTAPSRPGNAYL